MVFNRIIFLFALFFLTGYYTPVTVGSPTLLLLLLPAGLVLTAAGRRLTGRAVICSAVFVIGAMLSCPLESRSEAEYSCGTFRLFVETTTLKGALLRSEDGSSWWASGRNIAGSVARGDSAVVLAEIDGDFMDVSLFSARPSDKLHDRIRRYLSGRIADAVPSRQTSSLAAALITGERGGIPETVRDAFRDTGTSHLLALSGLHVGVVAAVLLSLFKVIFGKRLTTALAVLILVVAYVFVSGGRASTLRAGWMLFLILLLGHFSGRTPDILCVWSITVLAFAALYGRGMLNDAGAQLSFAAVLSLIIMGRRFFGWAGGALSLFHAGLVVTVALAPLVAAIYRGFRFSAPLATVISMPFMLALMASGILTMLPPLSKLFSIIAEWIVFIWLTVLRTLTVPLAEFSSWMWYPWAGTILLLVLLGRRSRFRVRFR
ncbi:MAG: hypothetical protein GF388_08570 [Candidatus Aegiribacteria sp.]|nr:hypothetical protein [Candidatus Aegiribacteria sp.]MBD3295129.1 hypothetical protein [Candidatus Fermentibacteria bacterium]